MAATLLSIYATPPSKLRRPTQRARPSTLTCNRARPAQTRLDAARSALALSTTRAFFGTQQKTTLTLSWNIVEQVNQIDWIGMYEIGESNPFNYIDYKSYGVCGQSRGEVQWILRKRIFLRRPRSIRQVKVCFKYYDGLTGVLRAVSPSLLVFMNPDQASESTESAPSSPDPEHSIRRPLRAEATVRPHIEPNEFIITDIQCRQLRKSRTVHSQYYSKLVYAPMSYKTKFCTNSVAPEWHDLNFVFSIDRTRELSLFIKEKTWAGSSVVGHVNVSVGYLLDQHRTVNCIHDTRQFAFVLRPATKNGQRKSSVCGIFSGQMLLSVKFRGEAIAGEPLTVDGLLHTAPPAEARLAEASEAQLTDTDEGGDDDDEQAVAPLTPLAHIPSDQLDGDLETTQSDPETAEEDMACAGPSGPRLSVRRARSRRRHSSASEPNLTGQQQAESTSCGLAAMKGKNSDSGISQCSQTGDTPLKPESPAESPAKHSTRRKLSIKSPRIRRPETLSLFEGGKVTHVTNVFLCNGNEWTQQSHRSAATVLKSPYTVCTPCLTVTVAPGSSKASECRCRSRSSAGHSIEISLPSNWEARVDRHGRVFFVDHVNRMTCWEKPCLDGKVTVGQKISEHAHRRQMDKRYICLRRTIGDSQTAGSTSQHAIANDESTWPAVRFLQRQDFVSLLHDNPTAKEIYATSTSVKHIIHRIRKDAQKFERYQHNRDLVALVNAFADQTQVLPPGWQMKQESNGKILFIDHNRRRTTFIDPRLPTVVLTTSARTTRRRRALSAPPTHGRNYSSTDEYHRRVIQFLRQPTFDNLLNERLPTMAQDERLRKKLATIAKQGLTALHKLANDIDVITVLSLFESEISGDSREGGEENGKERDAFEKKLSNFYETLRSRGYAQGPGKIKLTLRRKHLLTDAFEQVSAAHKRDLQRNRICIAFDDEDGLISYICCNHSQYDFNCGKRDDCLDYGGPSREFFFLLSRDLFNPYYGLFEYSANDTYTVQISPMSAFVDNYIEWFYFCGRVLGLALLHRYLIDTFFTRAFYKFLLKQPCSISDLESLDSQFHSSLQWLQDNPVTEDLQLTFTINEEIAGKVTERELKANGSELVVTEENKDDYIRRIVRWRLERGVRKQGQSLLRGFYEVVDPSLVSVFDARELELVLSGTVEIDICDWRQNTEYKGSYNDMHAVICWFWQAVERFTNAQRLQLLQFVTGTSSIPYEGFVALRGSHGPKKFTIEKWGSLDSLPRAHTCFNRLDLPAYPSFHILYDKLLLAISETGCYAIE